jgi:hypothetical protein
MIKESFLDLDKLKSLINESAHRAYKYYTEEEIHEDGVDGFSFESCVEQQFDILYEELFLTEFSRKTLTRHGSREMIRELVEENKNEK